MARFHQLVNLLIIGSAVCNGMIDTHFHALPPAYTAALSAAGGDPSGFPTPDWSIEAAINFMNALNSSLGVLSISTPGVPIAGTGQTARNLARTLNHNFGNYSTEPRYSSRLAFFGVLPDWQDVDGTLAEIDYLYTQQKLCFGVTVYTTYGSKLLSHPSFVPIWQKLQTYKALVFLHPGLLDVTPKFIFNGLPQPIVDYPLATTRSAVDLVMSGTVKRYPDIDIILSHAGGTVPFIGNRAIGATVIPSIAAVVAVNVVEAQAGFRRFYYDTALSASAAQLNGLLDFADPSHVIFGSDFPYAPPIAITSGLAEYAAFVATNSRGQQLSPSVLRTNVRTLLNKHSPGRVIT